jgi:hypothetical protein
MSNQQEALNLAVETLSEIFKDSTKTSTILRRCLTISTLLGKEKEQEWIKTELEGYKESKMTYGELQKIAPSYRKVRLVFNDKFGRRIIFPKQLSIVEEEVVTESMGEIEDSIQNGLTILSGGIIDVVREMGSKEGFVVANAHIEGLYLKNISEQVRNRAQDFVNSVIKELGPTKEEKRLGVVFNQQTEDARLLLYSLENKLRQFVSSNIKKNNGKIDNSILRAWESSRRKEFMPPRQPLRCDLINYSSFEHLKMIIVQNENWEKIFKGYFGRPDGVISRLNELDDIRDTIAHNRLLSDFDFTSFKTLYGEITGCLDKWEKETKQSTS